MADEKPKARQSKLFITACVPAFTANNEHGAYTIYEIEAKKENGDEVQHTLRSFEDLPIGELLDLYVTKHIGRDGDESFRLAQVSRGPRTSRRVTELEKRVKELEAKVEAMITAASGAFGQ